MTVQLDQSSRRLAQLEEEKKSTDQSLKRTQGMVDDLKGKLAEWQNQHLVDLIVTVFLLNIICLFDLQQNQKGRQRS